jgi:hypothetical protein
MLGGSGLTCTFAVFHLLGVTGCSDPWMRRTAHTDHTATSFAMIRVFSTMNVRACGDCPRSTEIHPLVVRCMQVHRVRVAAAKSIVRGCTLPNRYLLAFGFKNRFQTTSKVVSATRASHSGSFRHGNQCASREPAKRKECVVPATRSPDRRSPGICLVSL